MESFGALSEQGSMADMFAQQREDLGIDTNLAELQDIQLQLADRATESGVRQTRIAGAGGQTLAQADREGTT